MKSKSSLNFCISIALYCGAAVCGNTIWENAAWSNPEDFDLDSISGLPNKSTSSSQETDFTPSLDHHIDLNRFYLENTLTTGIKRNDLLVPLPITQPQTQNRTSLSFSSSWNIANLQFTLSDRLNLYEDSETTFGSPIYSQRTLRNDFREGFISYEIFPQTFLEAGRINIRNGVALGFNPTDYFRSRTLVDQASIDPSALREDRLGTFLIQGQKVMDQGAIRVAFAPKLQDPSPLFTLENPPHSLDFLFGRTNSEHRLLITANYDVADLSPQTLVLFDSSGIRLGLNLSQVLSSSTVGYIEWSGGSRRKLSARAIDFGISTSTLPSSLSPIPQSDTDSNFQNDLSLGISWTSRFKLNLNLEYHFHQEGFTAEDFSNWISTGQLQPPLQGPLWYIRSYAADQQEPLMQHQFFFRVYYPDFIYHHLNGSLIAFINPKDRSTSGQLALTYFLSSAWTLGTYFSTTLGSLDSEKGSLPRPLIGAFQIVFYL